MEFRIFKEAVAARFASFKHLPLVRTQVSGDELWTTYLGAFRIGANPIFRERTEHDCDCCKQFVRAIGNVCAIHEGKLISIWDISIPSEPDYQGVANALSDKVKAAPIDSFFLHYERTVGTDKNFEELLDKSIKTWEHFHVALPPEVVKQKDKIASILGSHRGVADVFTRGLNELTDDAIDTVLDLIRQNSLYRGEEFKGAVEKFHELKKQYSATAFSPARTDAFVWSRIHSQSPAILTIRNSAIGTLLVDLSEGVELEHAVKSFEAKVAPTNYKRPTALVTKRMIDDAKQTVADLGLTSALERRYARLTDITVNNVLYASRSTKSALGGDVFDSLSESVAVSPKSFDKVEEVPIDKFLEDIVPTAKSIEVLLENRHSGNFVSLIAPVDPTAPQLFKWGNGFSWSYTGNVTDSIKQRVKAAGGVIDAPFCCRLAWENSDDLDFYMFDPAGERIYFGHRRSAMGGCLDVDANGMNGMMDHPVENIYYSDLSRLRDGSFNLRVNNYNSRGKAVDGFDVEIEILGETYSFNYPKKLRQSKTVDVATITKRGDTFTVSSSLAEASSSKDVWSLKTQNFVEVGSIMLSPNHWDGHDIGNRHWFFMLNGCRNEGTARGLYNEFLRSDLDKHRKVMEMVGSKMHTENSDQQLSGLGFSSTKRDSLVCRVTGSFSRVVRVLF